MQAITPEAAAYRHPTHQSTPLHVVAQLVAATTSTTTSTNTTATTFVNIIQELLTAHPDAIRATDRYGHIPLHYAISNATSLATLPLRSAVVRVLLQHDPCRAYWLRNDVSFYNRDTNNNDMEVNTDDDDATDRLCSPLYHVLLHLPDDPTTGTKQHAPTVEWIRLLLDRGIPSTAPLVPNPGDGDAPLALLYRRFTRQFDRAEAFFAGDNSRPAVVQHRKHYTTAAGHTWKCIELVLLLQSSQEEQQASPLYRTVHRAVATGRTPPDVLRYMIETHAADVRIPDEHGKCPLHYAASAVTIPPSYSKYVLEELLYKYPEAAAKRDINDHTPLYLAITAGKQWVSGGVKALYDAYPEALQDIPLEPYPHIRAALHGADDHDDTEQYDAIVQVQQPDASIVQVVTSMWAHEEDAGVQMLGCVSIAGSLVQRYRVEHVALTALPAVVNAMKAHPNEAIVQEKACAAIAALSAADGQREVSLVATGAVAAVVGALQAHVSDATVQHTGCVALTRVCHTGPMHATVVASVSGLTALLNAMAAHPHDALVQIAACQALVALTQYTADTAWVPPLERSQAEPLLQTAVAQFHECAAAVETLRDRMQEDTEDEEEDHAAAAGEMEE